MKRHEIQKPLIQSALVLLAVFILIGFVAGSNAHSVTGGIVSIFKGVFFSVLFAIALTLALILSVVILIAIFLGAVALYSPDSSREMYYRLRDRVTTLYATWASCRNEKTQAIPPETDARPPQETSTFKATETATKNSVKEFTAATASEIVPDTVKALSKDVAALQADLKELQKSNNSLVSSMEAIQESLASLPVDITLQKAEKLELQQEELSSAMNEFNSKIEAVDTASKDNVQIIQQHSTSIDNIDKKIASYVKELEDITAKMITAEQEDNAQQKQDSPPDDEHRIFTYFDKQEDKDKLAAVIEEAVTKEMTYAEIDKFLSDSLPKKLDVIIKEHPSLTKDYIRDRRKQ